MKLWSSSSRGWALAHQTWVGAAAPLGTCPSKQFLGFRPVVWKMIFIMVLNMLISTKDYSFKMGKCKIDFSFDVADIAVPFIYSIEFFKRNVFTPIYLNKIPNNNSFQ